MHTTRFKMILSLVTAATLALPAFSADEPAKAGGKPEVKVTVNGKKYIGDSPTIIIPTVYLKLAVSGKVSATKQASGLSLIGSSGGGNTVKAKAQYAVEGLEKKFAQELAQKVHDDLVAQLKAAGFTVKTYADVKDVEGMKAAKRETADKGIGMPTAKDGLGSTVLATAAPSDE